MQAEKLRKVGLPIADDAMLTPNSVAGHVFRERGVRSIYSMFIAAIATPLMFTLSDMVAV